jgi:hypothetical protein
MVLQAFTTVVAGVSLQKKITVSQNVLIGKPQLYVEAFLFLMKFSNYYCIASLITLVRIKSHRQIKF